MGKIKDFFHKIFVLPSPAAYIVSVPMFVFVGAVLYLGHVGPLAYAAYFLSAYALVVFCIAIVRDVTVLAAAFKRSRLYRKICEIPIVAAFIRDRTLLVRLSLYFGALINILYVILKIATGIAYKSYWLIFYGLYYLALAILRVFIIEKDRKNVHGEKDTLSDYKRYRTCGIILLMLNIVISFITLVAVKLQAEIDYPGVLIFGMAFYSFYAVIVSLVGTIKYRKHESVMLSAAKVSSFTAALVSMLSLEIAMTARFGAEDYAFRKLMTAVTGAGVFIIVFILAVMMIVRAGRLIKNHTA